MKVQQFLLEPFFNFHMLEARNPGTLAVELLERVNLSPELLSRYPNQLSGGQLQRIVFARVTSMRPLLVICDEPTSALDTTILAQVIALFQDLQKKIGFASLFITHELALAKSLCQTIYVMHEGAVVEKLTSDNIAEEAVHPATLRLIEASCALSAATGGPNVPMPKPMNPYKSP